MPQVTQKEIAKHAGVSRSTVREVLLGNPRVAEETRRKILRLVEEMNYVPHSAAQALINRRGSEAGRRLAHGTIGCVGLSSENRHYWTHLMEGVQEAAVAANLALMLVPEKPGPGWERVDGLLIHTWPGLQAKRNLPMELPSVLMLHQDPAETCVVPDYGDGVRQAVDYLFDMGHRRIAYLIDTGPKNLVASRMLKGYNLAFRARGIKPDPRWLRRAGHVGEMRTCGRGIMEQWLREDWKSLGCTALLAMNDHIAMSAMEVLSAAGYKIPDDISVVGFDSTEECDLATPGLTSVEVPQREIGSRSIEVLHSLIKGDRTEPEIISLAVHMRIRNSVRAVSEK